MCVYVCVCAHAHAHTQTICVSTNLFECLLACHTSVSLPRLQEFDWRVDVKSSSDAVSRMAVPTCLLQMKVRATQTTAS